MLITLICCVFFPRFCPHKKKNTGILIVKTWDTEWNKLGNVSFDLDDEEYETNNKGRKKILVTPNETHTIEFGDVEGYAINILRKAERRHLKSSQAKRR